MKQRESIVSTLVEWMLYHFDGIAYYHDWGLGWSFMFYLTMYPMLMLHHFKQVWAYLLSIGFIYFYILYFHINVP
jgi:hypothetical protein